MPDIEKTYILKHTKEGISLVLSNAPAKANDENSGDTPELSTLTQPRWSHWYQRKLARPWQAVLLSMNIDPHPKARRILKAHDPETYRIYIDRLDILKTLIGYEISYLEDHVRDGDGANEKYLELAEFCRYAEGIGWSGIEKMREGLRLDVEPPILKMAKRQESNLLRVLDGVFLCAVPEYLNKKRERSPAAVLNWLNEQGDAPQVSEATLRNWFRQMADLEGEVAG